MREAGFDVPTDGYLALPESLAAQVRTLSRRARVEPFSPSAEADVEVEVEPKQRVPLGRRAG